MPIEGNYMNMHNQIHDNLLLDHDKWGKAGELVGGNLATKEQDLIDLYSKPVTPETEKQIQVKQTEYQRAQRIFQAFQELLKNSQQRLMELIRGLRLN